MPKVTKVHLTPKPILLVQFSHMAKKIKSQRNEVISRVTGQVVAEMRPELFTLIQCFF